MPKSRLNPKSRSTLSAPSDPRLDPRPQKAAEEEERTRNALREIRKQNADLSEDIRSLEVAIGEPAFRRLMEQVTSPESSSAAVSSTEPSSGTDDTRKQLLERCQKLMGPRLARLCATAGKDQKLCFGLLDVHYCRPKLFFAQSGAQLFVSLIGPPDIRKRSSGSLRIADRIVSLDCLLISDLDGAHKGREDDHLQQREQEEEEAQQKANPSAAIAPGSRPSEAGGQDQQQLNGGPAPSSGATDSGPAAGLLLKSVRESVERYIESSAGKDPPLVVFGLLRENNKIMALTGDWVQVQVVHLPNDYSDGLGFGIVGGHSTGVVIKSVIQGSVADKDQRLRPGDRILQIGQISTQGLNSQQIAALLRQQQLGPVVQLTVARPIQLQETRTDTPLCWTMATRAALTATVLDEEVQRRLEALEQQGGQCNGLSHQQDLPTQPAGPIQEGTEFPDQLCTRLVPELDPNRPSTSAGLFAEAEAGRRAEKTFSTEPLEQQLKREDSSRQRRHRTSRGGTSNSNWSCSSSSDRRSLRQLQELALSSFCREKWPKGKFQEVRVQLDRDPTIGLGITVAGYVYKKEEISGVFVKSLVPHSSAHLSRQIQLHDLIVAVNGRGLEGLSHAESVRTLIRSGHRAVQLDLVRFDEDTSQAKCLRMLHEQELTATSQPESASTSTAPPSVLGPALSQHQHQQSLVDYKSYWAERLGPEFEVILVDVQPDERVEVDGGLGIDWQGTVDICDGNQLCSHHFIDCLRRDGPAARTGLLKAGDELLQANEVPLFGESFVKVRKVLSRLRQAEGPKTAATAAEFVRLIFCRKAEKEHLNFVEPSPEQCLPLAFPLLASMMAHDEHFIKAKSELRLSELLADDDQSTPTAKRADTVRLKSRSLENLSGLAVWNCIPIVVALRKDAKGLGFSVADYQDPLHPLERVIVVRSLVPGGAAQADGRIVPGDRLLFVNQEDLSNCSLERAVEVLKAAPIGKVLRLGIAKPVPIEQCRLSDTVPLISRSERLLAKAHSPRGRRRRRDNQLLAVGRGQDGRLLDPCCSSSAGSSQEEIWIDRRQSPNSPRATGLNPQLYFPFFSGSGSPASPRSQLSALSPRLGMPHMQQTAVGPASSAWTPCSSRSLSPCASPAASSLKGSWSYDIVYLPSSLERHIKLQKGPLSLGLLLDADADKAINGCLVRNICSKKAVARDGRLQPGDLLIRVNGESLRNVTGAQARAILKRANLVGVQCSLSYITASDAKLWRERFPRMTDQNQQMGSAEDGHGPSPASLAEQSRLSPKVYPKFYRPRILDENPPSPAGVDSAATSQLSSPCSAIEPAHSTLAPGSPAGPAPAQPSHSPPKVIALQNTFETSNRKFEQFAEQLLKDAYLDALFELYILTRKGLGGQQQDWSSADGHPRPYRRSASVDVRQTAGVGPPRAANQRGILRRASSSLKKKYSALYERIAESPPFTISSSREQPRDEERDRAREMSAPAAGERLKEGERESPQKQQQQQVPSPRTLSFWSEPRTVILSKSPEETFGISIVGGRVEVSQKGEGDHSGPVSSTVAGIFIKSVVANSPAGRSGQLFMGDRVLSVNDVDLTDSSHEQAVQTIKRAQNPVKFSVQSLQTMQTFLPDQQQQAPSKKESSASNSVRSPLCSPAPPVEVDPQSAAALERLANDPETEDAFRYTERKVARKYGDLPGLPVLIRLENIPAGGLGLILSARRDEGENRPPVIVVGVRSDSLLPLQVGDELLEINGRVLFGLSHQDATEKIKQCCQHNCLSLLILRKNIQGNQSQGQQQEEGQGQGHQPLEHTDSQASLPSGERKMTGSSECELGARRIVAEVLQREEERVEESDDAEHQQTVKMENNNNEQEQRTRPRAASGDKPKTSKANGTSSRQQPGAGGMQTLNSGGGGGGGTGTTTVGGQQQTDSSRKRSWQMDQQQSQMLQKCAIQVGQETLIEIDKDGKGLGLSIVGGSDTVLGTVVIHEVYPDGAAAIDGRLKPGDQVLEVNGTSLRGISHEQAISLLRRTPARVRLLVYRDQNLQMSLLDPAQIYNILSIELVKKGGKGLGISIVGRKNEPGVYVSEIVKGGVADSDGRLMQGDQILAVNSQDVANCLQEDVATVLKTCTGKVSLKVGRWKLTETAQRVRSAQPPAAIRENCTPLQQQQQNIPGGGEGPATEGHPNGTKDPPPPAPIPSTQLMGGGKLPPPTLQITLHDENNQQQSLMGARCDLSPVSEEDLKSIAETTASEETTSATTSSSQRRPPLPPANSPQSSSAATLAGTSTVVASTTLRTDLREPGCESLLMVLKKEEGQQWGMGIGKRPRGILITSLQPGSSAAEKLAIGDRIMAVNGHEVTSQQHSAVTYIRSSGNSVALQISRPNKPFLNG